MQPQVFFSSFFKEKVFSQGLSQKYYSRKEKEKTN